MLDGLDVINPLVNAGCAVVGIDRTSFRRQISDTNRSCSGNVSCHRSYGGVPNRKPVVYSARRGRWDRPCDRGGLNAAYPPAVQEKQRPATTIWSGIARTIRSATLLCLVTRPPGFNFHVTNEPLAIHARNGVSVQAKHPQNRRFPFSVLPYVE